MTHLYGHKFTSVLGEGAADKDGNLASPAQTWAAGLSGLTGEQLAQGLRACLEREDVWPPTLPEFRQMCLGKGKNEFGIDYIPEYYRAGSISHDKRLSSDERDKRREKGKRQAAKLKESLR